MLNTWITLFLAILIPGGLSPVVGDGGPPDGLEATLDFLDQEACTNMCENHGCIFDEHHIRIDGTQDANTNDPIELWQRGYRFSFVSM